MTWTDAAANSEEWTGTLGDGESALLDESGNELLAATGEILIHSRTAQWSDAPANSETWT